MPGVIEGLAASRLPGGNGQRQSGGARVVLEWGRWRIESLPEDGGRIAALSWEGQALLSGPPARFKPPTGDYGAYELRPVYGYDDCLPTVDPCRSPGREAELPDHGEIWQQPAAVSVSENSMTARSTCSGVPLAFSRTLECGERSLTWRFEVVSRSDRAEPFLHVMHALLPLERITDFQLPEFASAVDERTGEPLPYAGAEELRQRLLGGSAPDVQMVLLRGTVPAESGLGEAAWRYDTGLEVRIRYPVGSFPTLGIWWNRGGHPDEPGLGRFECAFEPIPGSWSSLERAAGEGSAWSVGPGERVGWEIVWEILQPGI